MSKINIQQTLDAMEALGIVIVGRNKIENVAANNRRKPGELLKFLVSAGPMYGFYLYRDPVSCNGDELARKLVELGFDQQDTQVVVANLRPAPTTDPMPGR